MLSECTGDFTECSPKWGKNELIWGKNEQIKELSVDIIPRYMLEKEIKQGKKYN